MLGIGIAYCPCYCGVGLQHVFLRCGWVRARTRAKPVQPPAALPAAALPAVALLAAGMQAGRGVYIYIMYLSKDLSPEAINASVRLCVRCLPPSFKQPVKMQP